MKKNIFEYNCKNNCKNKAPKKFNFCQKKDNALKSLNEVEFFLRDLKRFKNYIKLYKIIKK